MNYKVGDEVMCIDATPIPGGGNLHIVLGKTYTVLDIHACKRTYVTVNDGTTDDDEYRCRHCHKGRADYLAFRFIKLDKVTARSEVTSEAEAI